MYELKQNNQLHMSITPFKEAEKSCWKGLTWILDKNPSSRFLRQTPIMRRSPREGRGGDKSGNDRLNNLKQSSLQPRMVATAYLISYGDREQSCSSRYEQTEEGWSKRTTN